MGRVCRYSAICFECPLPDCAVSSITAGAVNKLETDSDRNISPENFVERKVYRTTPEALRCAAIEMYERTGSYSVVAFEYNVSVRTVQNWVYADRKKKKQKEKSR